MKLHTLKYLLAGIILTGFASCGNDDDFTIPEVSVEFTGTYAQQDQMGRAAINTVLGGSSADKNEFNVTIPSNMVANFQQDFLQKAVDLHGAFGVEYETNILNLDAPALTTILAQDVLQVAPEGVTTYYDGANVLTGRQLTDDVVDVSLILLFGGMNGDRFNGQDTDNDGNPDLPILVTDNVSYTGDAPSATFPYLQSPE
ncbi:DUF4331 family protein [Dokdonia sp. Hel_I_53]|uniref:DUF4331 family protein n=1 Tax=Dokdonia sp. Hel_I_53 TaxID=1566287 RepID=UPI001199AF6B|nr:DUF4331 family protein [Dokdonia sp. Hel_I_53]TVZ51971.1 uncharacterized protein DUF4331 [Dokdonia sp. Hel_I_53]